MTWLARDWHLRAFTQKRKEASGDFYVKREAGGQLNQETSEIPA
jgi:hypothetical protein